MLNLPNECLFEILNNFKSYNNVDYRSLFSCLLVNRQWCRSAIPILWSKIEISNNGKLIRICLSELNTEEKALLIPFRIFLPNNPKPLFEYLAYTTDLIIDTTYGIQEWLCDSIVLDPIFSFSTQNAVDAVGDSLIRLFLRTSKKLKYLTFLSGYLLYNPLGLEGIQVLAKALDKDTTLTSLTLGYIPISSKAKKALAEVLCKNTTITFLYLANNQLGDEGGKVLAEALYENTTLTHLYLKHNQLGIEGAKAFTSTLCKNTSLTFLSIEYNQFGNEGGKAIADALCKNTTLTSLNLNNNQISSEGGKALAAAFYKNTTLTHLYLESNQLDVEEGKAFVDALQKNTVLRFLYLYDNNIDYTTLDTIQGLLRRNRGFHKA